MRYKVFYDSFIIESNKQAIHFIKQKLFEKAKLILVNIESLIKTKPIRNLPLIQSTTYHSKGLLYKKLKKDSTALNFFLNSVNKACKNFFTCSSSHFYISQIYLKFFQYAKALSHGLLALESSNAKDKQLFSIYKCIGKSYKGLGNHLEALRFFHAGSELAIKTFGQNSHSSLKLMQEYKNALKNTNFSKNFNMPNPINHIFCVSEQRSIFQVRSATPSPSSLKRKNKLFD